MNSLPHTVSPLREEDRGGVVRERDPGLERRRLVLVASVLLVFACFFAIGRATHSASTPTGGLPSSVQAASAQAGIPSALDTAAPIESNAALETIAAADRSETPQPKAATPSISIRASLQRETQTAATDTVSAPSVDAAASPAVAPVPVSPAPAAPAPVSPAPVVQASPPSSRGRSTGSSQSGSSAGGGSFDSSG